MSAEQGPVDAWLLSKPITIEADAQRVWDVLTEPKKIRAWMSDVELEVLTDWRVGGSVISRGDWHGIAIENRSKVLAVEPGKHLVYTHWSSLSRFPDRDEYHSRIRIDLAESGESVILTVEQRNLLNAEIFGHWNFYWNMALGRIKRMAETGRI